MLQKKEEQWRCKGYMRT